MLVDHRLTELPSIVRRDCSRAHEPICIDDWGLMVVVVGEF